MGAWGWVVFSNGFGWDPGEGRGGERVFRCGWQDEGLALPGGAAAGGWYVIILVLED